jgi:hypothetical protein
MQDLDEGDTVCRTSHVDQPFRARGSKDSCLQDDFMPSQAGSEAKNRFIKAVTRSEVARYLTTSLVLMRVPSSRSSKRIRDAAQQFTVVARGLEGSSFGYATVSM